jgi:hypothetical protein
MNTLKIDAKTIIIQIPRIKLPNIPQLDATVINKAVSSAGKSAKEWVDRVVTLEQHLSKKNLVPLPGSHTFSHQSFFGRNPEALKLSQKGLIGLRTAIGVAKK